MAYTDLATVRAMDGMSDSTNYRDDDITDGIAFAKTLIDEYTGTSWEADAFSLTIDGRTPVGSPEGGPLAGAPPLGADLQNLWYRPG